MPVLRLLRTYNEKDIIRENIEYYINQNIDTIVLDNYSKDGTYEILKEYEGRGIRWIERVKTKKFDELKLNSILLNLAFQEKEDYFIWIDADEILCPFDKNFPLKDIIIFLFDYFKNDCFNAAKLEFYHTDKSALLKKNYSFKDYKYFGFTRLWKRVIFKKDRRIKFYVDGPIYCDDNLNKLEFKEIKDLFYIKHYPYRSLRQAKKKIYRGLPEEQNGINKHYYYYLEDVENRIVRPKDSMIEYNNNLPDFFVKLMITLYPELKNFYSKIYNELN